MKVDTLVYELCEYAARVGLSPREDFDYNVAGLMDALGMTDFAPDVTENDERAVHEILNDLCDYAVSAGIIEDGIVSRDLFDTRLMGVVTDRPSAVTEKFEHIYRRESARKATDYFYKLSRDSNYIRVDRVSKDLKWKVDTEYGSMDISINLSKPEKDPKAIAAAKLMPQVGYPKCALCHENVGYAGSVAKPARQTLRQIPFVMSGERWYLQYSPYVYYNEHCIALSAEHRPMRIGRSTFRKLIGFVSHFPHYFIGSNADLPIVGGSILSHDHMQGGRYSFSMEKAGVAMRVAFTAFPDVEACILKWPMSVLRLRSRSEDSLVELSHRVLCEWRGYSDPERGIFAETDGTPHNTITPIARRVGEEYEIDLVLRNNITTEEHPLGVFHPHSEYHNIKKENIGLIEVMGLAVLPARLKDEMEMLAEAIVEDKDIGSIPEIAKHKDWYLSFAKNYSFTSYNVDGILKTEIGKTFVRVLWDAGVYKDNEDGRVGFLRFLEGVGGHEIKE